MKEQARIIQYGKLNSGVWATRFNCTRIVFNPKGLCPTITAGGGGGTEIKIAEMNTKERKIYDLVINKYGSVRAFTTATEMPNSTFVSIMERGILNSNFRNVIKISKALNVSLEQLAENEENIRERKCENNRFL